MTIDIIGVILVLLSFIHGYRKGLIMAAFSVAALLLGAMFALKCSESFSAWMLDKGYVSSGWVQVVSYVLLFIIAVVIVRFIAKLFQKVVEGLFLGFINRIAGGLLFAFLAAIIWSSVLWIGLRMDIITPKAVAGSHTYPLISGLAPWVFEQAGRIMPYVRDTFNKLDHFFDQVNQKIPGHVGAH